MSARRTLATVVLMATATPSLLGAQLSDPAPAPATPTAPASAPATPPDLRWLAADGTVAWSLRLDPPGAGVPFAPLTTTPRFPPFPSVDIQLLAGGAVKSEDLAGRVVLLDFWASWCGPCLEELPHLQKLYDQERERGLAAVAVNADEPLPLVKRTVAKLGLTLPIGIYDARLRELFDVRTLPTLVLVDRQGRVRGRWDGYNKGLERTIAERVRELLGDDREGRAREIAKVAEGAGTFEIAWALDLRGAVSGVAALGSARTDGVAVVAAAGDQLVLLDPAGTVGQRLKLPSPAWRLAAPPAPTRGAEADVLAFRWGASDVVSIDLDQGMMRGWSAPGPLFGLAFAEASRIGEERSVWLATLEGIGRADLAGREVQRIGEPAAYLSAVPGPAAGLVVLARDGTIRRFTASGASAPAVTSPDGSRQIMGLPGVAGVGVLSESVTASVVGAFLGGGSRQAVVATYDGVLAVVDLETGRVLLRALWPGVVALAAGDLDGDGRDELLVGAGRTVAALRAVAPQRAVAPEAANGN